MDSSDLALVLRILKTLSKTLFKLWIKSKIFDEINLTQ